MRYRAMGGLLMYKPAHGHVHEDELQIGAHLLHIVEVPKGAVPMKLVAVEARPDVMLAVATGRILNNHVTAASDDRASDDATATHLYVGTADLGQLGVGGVSDTVLVRASAYDPNARMRKPPGDGEQSARRAQ